VLVLLLIKRGIRKIRGWTRLDSFRERKFCSSWEDRRSQKEREIKKLGVTLIFLMIYFLFFIDICCDSLFHGRINTFLWFRHVNLET
jgi:hypothetical protein